MSKIEVVRAEMVKAMKSHDKNRKDALSMLVAALKNAEIDKRSALTEAEENAVVQKEIKQTKETLESCPDNREDIKKECEFRISVYNEFCPAMMTEEEIDAEIESVLAGLGIINPTNKEKGTIMKELMPRVKGKADGKLVNARLSLIMR